MIERRSIDLLSAVVVDLGVFEWNILKEGRGG